MRSLASLISRRGEILTAPWEGAVSSGLGSKLADIRWKVRWAARALLLLGLFVLMGIITLANPWLLPASNLQTVNSTSSDHLSSEGEILVDRASAAGWYIVGPALYPGTPGGVGRLPVPYHGQALLPHIAQDHLAVPVMGAEQDVTVPEHAGLEEHIGADRQQGLDEPSKSALPR